MADAGYMEHHESASKCTIPVQPAAALDVAPLVSHGYTVSAAPRVMHLPCFLGTLSNEEGGSFLGLRAKLFELEGLIELCLLEDSYTYIHARQGLHPLSSWSKYVWLSFHSCVFILCIERELWMIICLWAIIQIYKHTHTIIQFTTYCNSIGSPSISVAKMSIMGDIYGHPMHPDGYDHWLPKLRDP